jgi:glycine/D-amino acid oxidase-like deaminating enzyme/nitrite reductase/ring-hydroxylating ferredoxin subunit
MPAIESQRTSAWTADTQRPSFDPLDGDASADVIIVGGGITGLTAAEALYSAGRRVILIEMNRIGGGTTGYSTGHLDTTISLPLKTATSRFGDGPIKQLVIDKRDAINHVEQLAETYAYDHRFVRVPGYEFAEPDQDDSTVQGQIEESDRLGLGYEPVGCDDFPLPCQKAIRYPNQARFNPLAHIIGLAAGLKPKHNVKIHEQTRMLNVEEGDEGKAVVQTNRGKLTGEHVLLCGHAAMWGMFSLEPKVYAWQSYAITVELESPLTDGLYWDSAEPYRYYRRLSSDRPNLAIVGGEDHRTGDAKQATVDRFDALEKIARDRLPVKRVVHRWSHEFFQTMDGLPYIGALPGSERILIATGLSGIGLSFGTMAALMFKRYILDEPDPLRELLDPSRIKPLASAGTAIKSGAFIAGHAIADKFGPADVSDENDIPPGQGAIVSGDDGKLAVYRDAQGRFIRRSATCTHMKCTVQWNAAEKTWDCPCHGGRYDCEGRVLMGPPQMDLEPADS